jgi:hypothetical protein
MLFNNRLVELERYAEHDAEMDTRGAPEACLP